MSPSVRELLRADALFEAFVGMFLLLVPFWGWFMTFPPPITVAFLLVVGLLLLALVPVLWWFSRQTHRAFVLVVGAGNLASAAVIALWAAAQWDAFEPVAALVIVSTVVAALTAFGTLQLRAGFAVRPEPPA